MPSPDRTSAYWFGRIAEFAVIVFLTLKAYRVLAHRHATPYGEIDIVCTRGNTLIIIEVKARRRMADAKNALSPHQQTRLINAANYLISKQPKLASHAIRFDCCTVTWYMRIHHIKHAFM